MTFLSYLGGEAKLIARLIYSVNTTLDGCYDPAQTIADDEHHDYAFDLLRGATALILGRTTYELFESHWPHVARSGSGPRSVVALARELDSKTKYVASRQRTTSDWKGTVFLTGDAVDKIRVLKQQEHGDFVLFGSPGLARTLAEMGEIEEYHFVIQPKIAGHGPRIYDGITRTLDLEHLDTKVFRSGVQLTRWIPA